MCKMAHFGNCDPETADREYCIFHKPNKTEEEAAEFYNKFVLRFFGYKLPWNEGWVFAGSVNANEFVFPKFPKTTDPQRKTGEEFSFEGVVFESSVGFYNAVFEGSVSFDNAIFEGLVCFTEAEFNHFASFDNAQFKMEKVKATKIPKFCGIYETSVKEFQDGDLIIKITMPIVSFYKSKFHNGVSFYSATFLGITDFRGSLFEVNDGDELFSKSKYHHWDLTGATFNRAVFEGAVVFSNSKFRAGAEFSGTQFSWADFSNAKFEGENEKDVTTNFRDSVFEIGADFSNAKFKGTTVFVYTKIHREAKFNKAEFKGSENAEVAFKGALLEKVSFSSANFYVKAEFSSIDKPTNIINGNFTYCTFYKESYFYGVVFKGQTSFSHSTFRGVTHFEFAVFEEVIFKFAVFEEGASFKNVIFYGNVSFEEVLFEGTVEFQDAVFKGDALFKNSTFERLAIFTGKPDDEEYKFWGKLSFEDCDVYKGIQIDLPRELFRFSEAFIEAMRIQKLSYERLGRHEDADRVLVSLKREQRKAKNVVVRFFEWLLLDWSSEYFTNPKKILRTSVVVIIVFGIIYWISDCVNFCILQQLSITNCLKLSSDQICLGGIQYGCTGKFVSDLLNSLYFSMVTFTTLGFGDLAPTGLMKAFAATEALLGALLMAALVSVGVQKITR